MMKKGVQILEVPLHWVIEAEKRLDASFYAQDVIKAKIHIEKLKKLLTFYYIKDISEQIFWPGRFKRQYVSEKEGSPFLMPSEVFMFLPKPTKYIANYPSEIEVKKDWILITRSGSIGRTLISTSYLENFVLSDDLIRLIPKKNILGYVYAYLNTWIGQTFLTKDQYGATVKHIEPHHVANIPIPRIPEIEQEVNQKILEAHKLREEAQLQLLKAEEMIYTELGLPEINENDAEYICSDIGRKIKAFEVKASELDFRLDASYHLPIYRNVKNNLLKSGLQLKTAKEICKTIFIPPRFKRPYVENPSEGVPFLSGVNLIEIKPLEIKYIWKHFKKLNLYKVFKDWILISARGTIGRAYLVLANKPLAASDNIIRCITNDSILSGYLTAFLNTTYAFYQLQALKAGSVQDLLQPMQLEKLFIPIPSYKIQDKIGSLVIDAYNKKDKANLIEEQAIKQLEKTLEEIAKATT